MLIEMVIALVASVIVLQIMVFSTTIYLHRYATHRAMQLHPAAAWVFRFFLWITTGIVPREWVAVHRKHHAHTDEHGDPHSPVLEGFWPIQWGNIFYYIREARNKETVATYAKDIKRDLWDKLAFDYSNVGLLVGVGTLCLIFGWWGLAIAAIAGFLYIFVLSSSINGLCHHRGYKNFKNTAGNFRSIALITGGEGLHNNHHGAPRSPKFSVRKSEFDPAWPVLKVMEFLRLAKLGKVKPTA
ncbi:MAG TPA: fatty acid desaturase [Candidatus Polarisedimenticolaceae bacterium]|nr:fatty acid desaturase [Candidatus Polarisedimenticolaceae bacterium]